MSDTFDRDAAREVLRQLGYSDEVMYDVEGILDALEACVRPAPPQTIDRAALVTLLLDRLRGGIVGAIPLAGEIMALLRPVDGVNLTREEAALAAHALGSLPVDRTRVHYTKYLELAQRLGAAS